MVLADDDLGIHAEIAGAAENFDDPADRSGAFAGITDELGIDDGAIESRDVRETDGFAGAVFFAREELFAQSGRKFIAGGKLDFVLDARIVRNDDAAAGSVAEQADDGGVGAGNDAKDAAFGAAGAGHATEAGDFGDDVIAVHGVFDVIARDEEVSIEIRDGHVRNHKAIAILVQDQAASDFVAGKRFVLGEFFGGQFGGWPGPCGGLLRAESLTKEEAAVGKFFDQAALFELGEHLEQGATAGFFDLEGA